MSENIGRGGDPNQPKEPDAAERRRQEALEHVLSAGFAILDWDIRINHHFEQILAAVAGKVREDPGAIFSGRGDNISDLVSALRASKQEGGAGGGGVRGGDVVGGAGPSLGDIGDFIKTIGEHAEHEKKLLLKLIFLVFCNCDCVCKCLCD